MPIAFQHCLRARPVGAMSSKAMDRTTTAVPDVLIGSPRAGLPPPLHAMAATAITIGIVVAFMSGFLAFHHELARGPDADWRRDPAQTHTPEISMLSGWRSCSR